MSVHPTDYYSAKREALRAARAVTGRLHGVDPRQVDAILGALGWPHPTPALDAAGKPVKVYVANMRYTVPKDTETGKWLRAGHEAAGTPSMLGFAVGRSKAASADYLQASWVRKRTEGIMQAETTDYRYFLAAHNPDMVVFTLDGSEFGQPVFIPIDTFRSQS